MAGPERHHETRGDSPFRDLIAIQARMNRLFETALIGTEFDGADSGIGTWRPVSDVCETADSVIVSCELPGIDRDQIDIKLSGGVLTVSGERKVDKGSEREQYHRIERAYGPFVRDFTLPASVDAERISASYQNGVLAVTLPKRPESRPRRISVGA